MTAKIALIALALTTGETSAWAQAAVRPSGSTTAKTGAPSQSPPVVGSASRAGDGSTVRLGRIGVETFGPANLSPDLRMRLQEAAAAGLRASGADVLSWGEVERARTKAAFSRCFDWSCEQRLAQLLGAQLWLRGSCQSEASSYRVHLELLDAQTGAVQAARDDTCDICTEADVVEAVNVAASALKASLKSARAGSSSASSGSPSVAVTPGRAATTTSGALPPATSPAGTDLTREKLGSRDSDEASSSATPLWRRVLPWTAFALAAGATAAGIYYLAINGDQAGCYEDPAAQCRYHNETLWRWGIPLVGAGAALAATGVVLLLTESSEAAPRRADAAPAASNRRSTVLRIGADSIAVSGSF